jgi:hypothetical protein
MLFKEIIPVNTRIVENPPVQNAQLLTVKAADL